MADAERLVESLRAQLAPAPKYLQGALVMHIGGPNSLGAIVLRALGRDGDTPGLISVEDRQRLLSQVTDKTDEELLPDAGVSEYSDPPNMVVPRIALFLAVALHLQLGNVQFQPCIGSCAGLAVS